MRKLLSFASGVGSFAALVIACSSSADKPPPSQDSEGGTPFEAGNPADTGADTLPATCGDSVQNNDETDVNCGGASCAPCVLGQKCKVSKDCGGGADCEVKGLCAKCHDGIKNGDETDFDCGGSCRPCGVGKACEKPEDCGSKACSPSAGAKLACACPPRTTIISLSAGGAYCIDQEEISKGQYNSFITANISVATQKDACLAANKSFIPRAAWPPATAPSTIDFTLGLPVHYVDWCDAVAYCKWDGKQLCGSLDGKAVPPGAANNDPQSDTWFNACTAQGANPYPYGPAPYQPVTCNGDGAGAVGKPSQIDTRTQGFGHSENQDDGVYLVTAADGVSPEHKSCQGGSTGIYQMSGNVAEWEDSCDSAADSSPCRVRGGSYKDNNDINALRCDAVRSVPRMPTDYALLKDIGFRCCLY